MSQADKCAAKYRQLLLLLDDDCREISHVLQGDLLEHYREVVKKEKQEIEKAYSQTKQNLY